MSGISARPRPLARTAAVLALSLTVFGLTPAAASRSVSLPTLFDANDVLQARLTARGAGGLRLQVGRAVSGMNNVASLWRITKDNQPARHFDDTSAYAILQDVGWVRATDERWWIGFGRGKRDAYQGNADAGQLWIDLHAAGQTRPAYAPVAGNVKIEASWYGVGRTFPFRIGQARGTGSVLLRGLAADDYLARSLVGQVEGEMFSGMVKIVSADTGTGLVRGRGWSLDTQAEVRLGKRWLAQGTVEGLLGRLTWHGLAVEDSYVVSPRVFTDPEGFLHDYGGISGAAWSEDMRLRLNPYYRLDLICSSRPNTLLGVAFQAGTRTAGSAGLAWPQSKRWLPYLRCYPTQNRLEVGAVGSGWQVRISGDDWLPVSPKHAEIALSASALSF